MEIGQIEAFIAVATEGSFTKAADYLGISQPSLSNRIYRLERSLDGKLIDRRSRPVNLTSQGKAFLAYAERAMSILSAAEEMIRNQQGEEAIQLKIGCPFSVATYLMPEVVNRFSQSYPQAELNIETGNSDFVVDQLNDGLINLALAAAFPKYIRQTKILLRLRDEMTVAVSKNHPLASHHGQEIEELWPYRVLLIHWGPAFHAYIESLRQMSSNLGPLIRLPLASALPMAQRSDTVTFMPRRLVQPSDLVEIKIRDFAFAWDIAVMTRLGRTLAPLEASYLDIVDDVWKASEPT